MKYIQTIYNITFYDITLIKLLIYKEGFLYGMKIHVSLEEFGRYEGGPLGKGEGSLQATAVTRCRDEVV